METILSCIKCKLNLNTTQRTPRILPCNRLICTSCIEDCKQSLGGYIIDCNCSLKTHTIEKLDDLLISHISLACLNNSKDLKNQIDQYKYSLELAKFDVSRHYDDMEMKIDIRAETLIEFIHDSRDLLHAEIKSRRQNTESQIESFESKYNSDYKRLEHDFQLLNIKMSDPNIGLEMKNLEFLKYSFLPRLTRFCMIRSTV